MRQLFDKQIRNKQTEHAQYKDFKKIWDNQTTNYLNPQDMCVTRQRAKV